MPVLKGGSRPPWVGLGAAVWVQVAAGNAYNFPLYSPSLKSVLGYSQQQLTILGVANDIGENVGLLPGIVCNKFPPWVVLLIGGLASFLGYGVLWLAVSQTVQSLPYWLLWIALAIATNSSAWLGTAVLVTNMRNFPLSRGTIAGILKGYVGLSAAVYTEIYCMVLNESATSLLLFLTIGIPVTSLAMMYFVRPCTPSGEEDSSARTHFLFTQTASMALGIFLLTTTVINEIFSLSEAIRYTFVVIMVGMMLSPLAIPIKMTIFRRKPVSSSEKMGLGKIDASQSETLLLSDERESEDSSDVEILLAEGEGAIMENKRRPKRGEDFTFQEAFVKADFWLLWFVYFLGVGSGVTFLNNLAQIGDAVGVDDTTILLSLFSFGNFVGRLGGGVISEHFVRSKTTPRTIWMTFTQVIMIIIFLLCAWGLKATLYAATALLGICYGVQFAIMVPTASELFGLKNFGIIYNFMLLGNPLGALLFSGWLAGYIYDEEAAKQQVSTCLGPECFRVTFFVLTGVCGLGVILSVILTIRIKPVYKILYSGGSFRIPYRSGH